MGMGSRGYRDWEVPPLPHTSWRPASWWYNSVCVQRPEKAERGASGGSPSLGLNVQNQELWCLRAEGRCGNSSWEGEFTLSFCSIQALSGSGPPALLRVIFLTPPLIQMLISSPNTLTNTPRNTVLSTIWASFSFKLTYKINHHILAWERWISEWNQWWECQKEKVLIYLMWDDLYVQNLINIRNKIAIWRLYM